MLTGYSLNVSQTLDRLRMGIFQAGCKSFKF